MNKLINVFILAGLIGLSLHTDAQAQGFSGTQSPNPGVHRNGIINLDNLGSSFGRNQNYNGNSSSYEQERIIIDRTRRESCNCNNTYYHPGYYNNSGFYPILTPNSSYNDQYYQYYRNYYNR